MKFLLLVAGLLVPSLSDSHDCGEHKVRNWMNVCIEPEPIEGCHVYKSTTECHQCLPSYRVENGKCVVLPHVRPIIHPGCLILDNHQCQKCANGFRNLNGKCQQGIKDCVEYESDGDCSQCKKNFSLVLNECLHNKVLGCKIENSAHQCLECWTPFKLQGNHCDIKHCITLNDYGCASCDCGYYLDENKDCKKYENGCMRYMKAKCVDCLPHYQLDHGVCKIEGCLHYENGECKECKDAYELKNGECQIPNCFDWENDKCTSCKSGYRLTPDGCELVPELQCE